MSSSLITAAWGYRGFIASSIVNEFRGRFARSRFGTAWLLLHPLAQTVIFATVLSNILAARLPGIQSAYGYAVYLLAGLLCWMLFSEIVQRCLTIFVDQANLLRKMRFPRITLPLIVVGSSLVANVALLAATFALALLMGFEPGVQWLWLIILMGLTTALATGIGLLLAVLNVFARDIGQVMGVVLQFWYWVTPIVYPASIVPDGLRKTFAFNPLVPLVESYQAVIVYGHAPTPRLWFTVSVAAAFLALSLLVFRRASPELVDAL